MYIKTWSENDGIAEALEEAGIIKLTGKVVPAGYCMADHAELTDAAWEELQRQEGKRNASV